MKLVASNPHIESQNQRPLEDYQSWDPLTQAKFIHAINLQAGTPTTLKSAYESATQAIQEDVTPSTPSSRSH